jgi:nucleotide-binding universal stress UspA family protein
MTDPVVLVPLDGSKHALCALPVAKRLAALMKASVQTLDTTEAETVLASAAKQGAKLIVMAAHTADARPAGGIGAVAQAVLCGAACPVVLVDPAQAPDDWTLKCMLAPHDGSPAVSDALGPAIELAREAGGEFVVLQVAHDTCAQETGSIAPPQYLDQVQHTWPVWSGEFLQRLDCLAPLAGVQVRLLMAHGDPARETIRAAGEQSATLLALVWKGRWEAPHAAVLKAVLREAPCPVMVVRAHRA